MFFLSRIKALHLNWKKIGSKAFGNEEFGNEAAFIQRSYKVAFKCLILEAKVMSNWETNGHNKLP